MRHNVMGEVQVTFAVPTYRLLYVCFVPSLNVFQHYGSPEEVTERTRRAGGVVCQDWGRRTRLYDS